ncbi:CDP-diacylglycerol--glycerol-3-phosphate 3-phosphatidyltransferase [Flavobacterium arsenatis]|uniref:CDP-diacylglycerol--glycerol-3-phosphate 3-phosphatidyltransferase n=1 Tax=Flavobacterium arsenatis TaxID=1484332 RepID=A0ABU1TNR8_9FLAO|nr:CDP-alcohol phosphatidyltransferase family protein [Flavobacterium arsenatis]MDR6967088.1 CDP-diacylglycerol--glycerol-3-phosphate 3-phosphatidyltransferase [Flavobacterium arsenatis]
MLIYSRLIIGFIIVLLSYLQVDSYSIIAIILFTIGLLTDIFDGIIARKLAISTQNLRRLDSTIDQIFFVSVLYSTFLQCPDFFKTNSLQLLILVGFEALTYLVCFLKFKKEIATHAIASKIWTLILFSTLIQIMATCNSNVLFQICFYTGVLTRLEIIGIILLLKNWTNDVPSIYHAWLLRKGKTIKRNTLFNG